MAVGRPLSQAAAVCGAKGVEEQKISEHDESELPPGRPARGAVVYPHIMFSDELIILAKYLSTPSGCLDSSVAAGAVACTRRSC